MTSLRSRVIALLAAFLTVGLVASCGGSSSPELSEYRAEISDLTTTVATLTEELDAAAAEKDTRQRESIDADALHQELEEALAALEEEHDAHAQLEAEFAAQEAAMSALEDQLSEAETELELAGDLAAREAALEQERADALAAASQEAGTATSQQAQPESAQNSPPASACTSGQVDINSASHAELLRIYQIGPARADQVIQLRPFSSVAGLRSVSGIGPAHLSAIEAEGVACVN